MKFLNLFVFLFLFIVSCSEDDSSFDDEFFSNVSISSYKITSDSENYEPSQWSFKTITVGEVINNKIISETSQYFQNGISLGAAVPTLQYFYDGNLLVSTVKNGTSTEVEDIDTKHFFYDENQNLVGINWEYKGGIAYYRLVHMSSSMVYFERINLPYNDSSVQIQSRHIIEFDQNNNVIIAGNDNDLDGVISNKYQYSYFNGNLISVKKPNNTILTFEYSNVIDNFSVLREHSYGKKNLALFNSEYYAVFNENNPSLQSLNLSTTDLANDSYEVLTNNYYKKKTVVEDTGINNFSLITVTEFFFN